MELRWIAFAPKPISEALIAYALTREFHREVEYRQDFAYYCQWYRETAAKHQQELQTMQSDINLFGWFCRKRATRSNRPALRQQF